MGKKDTLIQKKLNGFFFYFNLINVIFIRKSEIQTKNVETKNDFNIPYSPKNIHLPISSSDPT